MKTLRRSKENRVIAGICGGIAEYFSLDPVLIRVLFLIMAFFGGAGIILYIVCWFIMPERDGNETIDDAEEVVDDSKKKTSDKIKDAIKNVAGEFVQGVAKEFAQDVAKELRDEFDETGEEIKQDIKEIKKEVKKQKKSSGIWFGIFLVFFGIVLLFRKLELIYFSWHDIWKFWPAILIFIGISCISMKRRLKTTLKILVLVGLLIVLVCDHSQLCCW